MPSPHRPTGGATGRSGPVRSAHLRRALAATTLAITSALPVALALAVPGSAHAQAGGTHSATHQAPAPSDLGQVPGYFRQQIGGLTVTALFDGLVPLKRSMLKDIDPETLSALVAHRHVPESPEGFQTAVNAYVVQRGGQITLVDAGTATCFGPALGKVLANLHAAGYRPEDVATVLVTHAHPDHLCGVATTEAAAAFPNATLWLAAADLEYWTRPGAEDSAPAPMRPLFDMARRAVAPYAAAGRLKRFGPGDVIAPGVQALQTPGHTPGHTSFLFDTGSPQRLLVWGDVLHYHAVQFARPQAAFEADTDRAQAVRSRLDMLRRSADKDWWVAGAHLPFPGLGHVRREGRAFAWVPTEYGPLP